MSLALALGKTLGELDEMPSSEFQLWLEFASTEGLPQDRIEATLANIGAYVGGTMGGKRKALDLIPQYRPPMSKQQEAALARATKLGQEKAAILKRAKKRKAIGSGKQHD